MKPGAYLGAYEASLAEVGIEIVKNKTIDLLKQWIVTVNRADKSKAAGCFGVSLSPNAIAPACGETGSVVKTKMLLDGYADWRNENEYGLNPVHLACAKGNSCCGILAVSGDVDFNVPSGVFKCKRFQRRRVKMPK